MRKLFTLALLLLLASPVCGAQAVRKEPLKIKSDTLQTDNQQKTAVFEGKVVARQGDMTLYADKVVVSYSGDGKELSKVEAFGNVRILQGNREATGAHGIYEPKEARIILDGSPKVVQGDDVVTGKVITYYVNEQRSVVTSGPKQRVEAIIHPGEQHDGKSKP
ncbi:lipopolysaccharide transport periplasmic protein LptA [Geomonas sp.]|uniref:lipopolysaccharide transport periplasmic protein LptA n=1 Tax=Geomonas sp. TaxID=2651584 RepID=UPI002B491701|nr:lipopolysaccharide transport periplasmic protein LptA [Geomonas sp.]HJV34448.1 lipopolysaccharide transport periplasmic protein LptA [Geomonas sp.]